MCVSAFSADSCAITKTLDVVVRAYGATFGGLAVEGGTINVDNLLARGG